MRRLLLFLGTLLLTAGFAGAANAAALQQPASSLEWLGVEFWPDYDRTAVLVLLTGGLPADAALPAQVTLPLPRDATLNAVARISDANEMIDDIQFERGEGVLTLTTPDRRFRVEYYMPYTADGLEREFVFNWSSGPAVAQVDVSVQQPAAAASLSTQPQAESVMTGSDGLQYHNLPVSELQAGGRFSVEVNYQMQAAQLTATGGATAAAGESVTPGVAPGAAEMNWPLILALTGGAILLGAIGWQLFGARLSPRRAPQKPRKPRPDRRPDGQQVRFCHQCGAKAQPGDRFCRECGTALKQG